MKISGNQRRLYLLSAALLVVTIVICAVFGVWTPASRVETATDAPSPSPSPSPTPDLLEMESGMRTVVYYQDNYGYLVPVTRMIPQAEGIAKATLGLMVRSAYNDMEAARLGLRTVLPEGTQIDLDVGGDGLARIDLSEQVLNLSDAEAEANMVAAVVQTLTEFPTIDRVTFLVGGRARESLTFGTDIAGTFERGAINLESAQAAFSPAQARTVRLYFPGETPSLIVPVTRMVYGNDDLETAVLELAKGPSGQSPLDAALPEGCGLLGVEVEDGVAAINFTKDFIRIAEQSDGGRAALRALTLTCTQFDDVESVRILVEGKPYDPGVAAMTTPKFVNDERSLTQAYIETQAAGMIEID